jgi:hypothetical protein
MRNIKKLLFAGLLIGAAMITTPKPAHATVWCNLCAASGGTDCFNCCVCDGGTIAGCSRLCH